MTPQSRPLELVNVEPENAPKPAPASMGNLEMRDLETASSLAAGATQLAHNLAWVPAQQESRQFRERCEVLTRGFRPLLAALQTRRSVKPVSEDFLRLQQQIFLLEGELEETCARCALPAGPSFQESQRWLETFFSPLRISLAKRNSLRISRLFSK